MSRNRTLTVCVLFAAAAGGACEDGSSAGAGGDSVPGAPFTSAHFDTPVPSASCALESLTPVRVVETEGIVAEDTREMLGRNEGWLPGQIEDVAVAPDGAVYALDVQLKRVWHFSADLRLTGWWGREGGGPGEFRNPRALAVDPRDGSLLVLEASPNRLHRLTADGDYLSSVRRPNSLAHMAVDIAVDRKGSIYLAHPVMFDRLEAAPGESQPLITVLSPEMTPVDSLFPIGFADLGERPWITSFVNPRLSSSGEALAVFFPFTNDAWVMNRGGGATHISGCLPEETQDFYLDQLADGSGGPQQAVPQLSAVHVEAGRIYLASARSTEQDHYHFDVFDRSGAPIESRVYPDSPIRLPGPATFDSEAERLIVYSSTGVIARLEVQSAEGT